MIFRVRVLLDSLRLFEIKSAILEKDKDLSKAEKLINYSKKNSARIALILNLKLYQK